jgi:hypothetical protein
VTWSEVVAPVASAYLVCALLVLAALRWPAPQSRRSRSLRTARDLRHWFRNLAVTTVGGYVVLLVIVFVFSVLIVGQSGALWSAAWSSLFLLAVSTPVFLALSWASGRRSG